MAGTISQKDMEVISNGIIDGLGQVEDLPQGVRDALFSYWGGMGIDATKPESSVTQEQFKQLQEMRSAQINAGGILNSPIFKPIEWLGSKLYWAYSNTVSPAVSAGAMAAHSVVYGRPDYIGEDGEWDAMKDYWNLSKNVSPGQSIWMLGFNDKELEERGIRPDQIAMDASLVKKGEYSDAKTENDPFGIRTRSEEYFGSGASKWVTGTTDFLVSWYADPLVLGLKGLGKAKAAGFTRGVGKAIAKEEKAIEKSGVALSDAEVNALAFQNFTQKQPFQNLVEQIMKVKSANPDNAALVLARDLPTLRKSPNGMPTARLLSQAKDASEVTDILRVTIGDKAARETLKIQRADLAYQIDDLGSKTSAAGTYYDSLPAAVQASPRGQKIKAAIDAQTKWISKMENDSRLVSDKVDAFNKISSMNFNSVTTPAGMAMKGVTQDPRLRPVKGQGIVKAGVSLIYNGTVGVPIKLAHSYSGIKPTNYIDVNDNMSWRQLDASLGQVKGLSRQGREMYVSQYINAANDGKSLELAKIEQALTHRIVDRFNEGKAPADQIDYDIAKGLYGELAKRRRAGQDSMGQRTFGGATMPDPANPGLTIRVAEIASDNGTTVLTPVLQSQIANNHILMDFDLFEKAIQAHGSGWQKLKNSMGDKWSTTGEVLDVISSTWKFAQLFRIGYGPRALADDTLSQAARFGMFDMMSRTVKGGKITVQDWHNQRWLSDRTENARVTMAGLDTHIEDLSNLQKGIKGELDRARAKGTPAEVAKLEDDLKDAIDWTNQSRRTRADLSEIAAAGQGMRNVRLGRQIFDPAFAGTQGALFRDLSSGDRNFANMMGSQADWYLNRMRRQGWENISPVQHGPEKHMEAWLRVINQQVANDGLAVQYLSGMTDSQLLHWLRTTPDGQAYAKSAPLKNRPMPEMVDRVKAQIDEWLNPAFPGSDAIRAAAREGKVTKDMLEAVPQGARPIVNAEALSYSRGSHMVSELMDRSMTGWYNMINQTPSRKLLRHPLFQQRYKAHLADSLTKMRLQGATHIDDELRESLQESARMNALDDVKKNTFTMDHETKMSYMMRNFGAFFGAQQESWNRWARIISDKPEILARVSQVYGAPARAGLTVDQDGNAVDAAGFTTDPVTGERKLVDYADRKVLIQIPDFLGGKKLNKFLGLEEDAKFVIPMSSAEIILNHGDGALPVGAGPYVQLAANNLPFTDTDANGDPRLADMYSKLGILPLGPKNSWTDFINPTTGQRAGQAADTMSETYQRNLWNMMQVETYKWDQGLRDTEPTWEELSDRASRWTWARTAFAFVLPLSVNSQDPYQYFRDEFNRMQDLDPQSADEKFYEKYGDSFYQFTQSMSKNNTGLRPTVESVQMSQYYKDLIDKVGPELAGVVVGAEGEGVYSEGAYYYQKTHAADVASGLTQRSNMSAREAKEEAERSLGWKQYNSYMTDLNSQLFDRGLKSYTDSGAEDLLAKKQALIEVLTSQRTLNESGEWEDNPYYNEGWEKAFNSMDKGYYDRTASKMRLIVNDPEIWAKAQPGENGQVGIRSEIYTLKTYLSYREELQKALIIRKAGGGSDDVNAQSNSDLKDTWGTIVMNLIEADTKFESLHNRYFATDMGFNQEAQEAQEAQATTSVYGGGEDQTLFDMMGSDISG